MLKNMVLSFWMDRQWPEDAGDYIFLGRAVTQVGSYLFGNAWTDAEPITRPPPKNDHVLSGLLALKENTFRDMDHFAQFNEIRKVMSPEMSIEQFFSSFGQAELSDEIDAHLAERDQAASSVKRMTAVIAFIKNAAVSETLQTSARPVLGGQFSDLPSWFWNSERIAPRFFLCRVNPTSPFEGYLDGPDHQFVYVRKSQLDRLTIGSGEDEVTSEASAIPATVAPSRIAGGSYEDLCAAFHAAYDYFENSSLLPWSKTETESQLRAIFLPEPNRELCRAIYAELAPSKNITAHRGGRGPRNDNRDKELEDFRRFFVAAQLQK
ncbi:hypothetical protein LJR030_005391 [Rhizobium sp. LjRoot30]|uniref:hypothetical protein n=1 Tax=Rhizobium sp. LjRoot30 TaxID=3342320 RepID=UPI003ECFC5C3